MLNLQGFDPGGTTGWARVWLPETAFEPGEKILPHLEFEVGQIGGSEKTQGRAIALMLAEYAGPIVIEGFTLRQFSQDADLLAPVRMIARIEQIIDILEFLGPSPPKATFYQQPALAKSTVTDARMRKWGIWTPGRPHANDGLRHCVTFLRRCKNDSGLRLAAFGI